jgi:hypothetical protein
MRYKTLIHDPLYEAARRLILLHQSASVGQMFEGDLVTPPQANGWRELLPSATASPHCPANLLTGHNNDYDNDPPKATANDWSNLQPMPSRHTVIPTNHMFSEPEMARICRGYIPQDMSDHWFIYAESERKVLLHRSWTGYCVYALHFTPHADAWQLSEIIANRDTGQFTGTRDDEDENRVLNVLRHHLLADC